MMTKSVSWGENSIVAKGLLDDLIHRGLDILRPRLYIIDGSKALHKAITDTFGTTALIQRCQVHKKRNVLSYLPESEQANVSLSMTLAYADGFKDEDIQYCRTIEKGHGRIEERRYYYSTGIKWMDARKDWTKMKGIGMVIRKVQIDDKHTEERQFHFGSVDAVKDYADAVRCHWNVESTHWSLDVTFREDASRTRKGKAPENLALLRRIALNVVKKTKKNTPSGVSRQKD